jgi:acetyl esterase/lipase
MNTRYRRTALGVFGLLFLILNTVDAHQGVTAARGSGTATARPADTDALLKPTEANVIYGMYSGLALLMDVYRPARANGYGVVFIPGSGWGASLSMSERPMKEAPEQLRLFVSRLMPAGYTVFVINHRASPRFQYPAQYDDVARAVRFIRHRASAYGIDTERIGAIGYSSGANLAALLGVDAGQGDANDVDQINRENARVQCVVAVAAPTDLTNTTIPQGYALLTAYLGQPISSETAKESPAHALLRKASPISYVTADDAPMLLVNGNQDPLVPIENVQRMRAALEKVGVPNRFVEITGASHWPLEVSGAPDFIDDSVRWFDRYLRKAAVPQETAGPRH